MIYRFIGTNTVIEGEEVAVRLGLFGQAVELPEDVARACPVLIAADFDGIGFTDDELARYAQPGSHADAPPEFLEKKQRALALLGGKRG